MLLHHVLKGLHFPIEVIQSGHQLVEPALGRAQCAGMGFDFDGLNCQAFGHVIGGWMAPWIGLIVHDEIVEKTRGLSPQIGLK